MKINVAVIGCGSWGSNHTRVYNELENARLVAVCDISEDRAREAGIKCDTDWCCNPQHIYDNPEVDAVSICTPTKTHYEISLKCIQANKHVLVESPMTETIQQAESLIREAEMHEVFLSVGFIERFNPAVQEAAKMITDGKIGDLIQIHSKRVSPWPVKVSDIGVIKDLAIHDIDIVNYLFKENPTSVYANAGSIKHSFEDYSNILIKFPNNRGAFLETNWLTPKKIREIVITGTQGIITLDCITRTVTLANEKELIQPYLEDNEPLKLELNHFIDSILKHKKPLTSGEDGLKALKICEAAIHSANNGTPQAVT